VITKPAKGIEPVAMRPQPRLPPLRLLKVEPSDVDLMALMSEREREIALLVTAGLSNKEIAQHLTISHWTVSTHLRRIFAKFDISRRVELCAIVSISRRYAAAER